MYKNTEIHFLFAIILKFSPVFEKIWKFDGLMKLVYVFELYQPVSFKCFSDSLCLFLR